MINWFKRRRKHSASYQTNEEWVKGLSAPVDERAVAVLREKLVRGLKPALFKYVDRELDQFVEDTAQDALLKILDNIQSFRGESKFITWAMKIGVREGLTELRRKRYNDISIEDLKYEENTEVFTLLMADNEVAPDRSAHETMLLEKVMDIINSELTDKQKTVITALMIHGLPISVVAEQLGTSRNALYKMVYDTRKKLKNRFEVEGINPDEIFSEK